MSNRQALEEFLTARPSVPPLLAELARSLAAEIDSQPETGMAALAKEYRTLCERLIADDSAGAAPTLGDLFSEVGDPT